MRDRAAAFISTEAEGVREGLGLWVPPTVQLFSLPQDAYSKRFISVACISRVAAIGDQKFEVITNNRTFAFRAESDGGEWDRKKTSSLA